MLTMDVKLIEGSGTISLDNTKSQSVKAGDQLASFKTSDYNTISTSANQTATLQFVNDGSIIRLDKNTKIKLVAATNSDNKTIAQANLEQGVLWGRVLTGDGVNFSYGGVVAGVRGTGIKFAYTGGTVNIAVPHSLKAGADAVKITCSGTTFEPQLSVGQEKTFTLDMSKKCTDTGVVFAGDIKTIYEKDRFVADNVVADIMYLNDLIAKNQLADAAQKEWEITVPKDTDQPTQIALCGKDGSGAQLNYWSSLKNSATQAVCQVGGILAIADFTDSNGAGEMRYLSAVA